MKNMGIFMAGLVLGFAFSNFINWPVDETADASQQNSAEASMAQSVHTASNQKSKTNTSQPSAKEFVANKSAANEVADAIENHAQTIAKMRSEIATLQQQNQSLQESLRTSSGDQQGIAEDDELPVLSEKEAREIISKQLQEYIPRPFSKISYDFDTVTQMDIIDLHESEPDYDWGYEMETTIKDFFVTQVSTEKYLLESVICKQGECEILVTIYQTVPSHDLFEILRQQSWWQFSSTNSRSSNGRNDNELAMFLFASGWQGR